MNFLLSLVGPDVLGGYVRAGAASLLTMICAHSQTLADILPAGTQTEISVTIGLIVTGVWSHVAKASAPK